MALADAINRVFASFERVVSHVNAETGFTDIFVFAPDHSDASYERVIAAEDALLAEFPGALIDTHVRVEQNPG